MLVAIATATRPTLIDTRAAASKRARTSRPAESVPSQCAAPGAFLTASRSTANGSGDTTGADMANTTTTPSVTNAAVATRSRRKRDQAVFVWRTGLVWATVTTLRVGAETAAATLAVSDTRVGIGIQHV